MKKVYIIAAIFAVISGIAIYKFSIFLEQKSQPSDTERVNVVLAVGDIKKDTIITDDMVKVTSVPKESLLTGSFTSTDQVIGKITVQSFVSGEQILSSKTVASGEKSTDRLSYELNKDEYAVTINVSVVTGTAGYIKEGDLLTITKVDTSSDGKKTIDVLYEHIKVIRVSENISRDSSEYTTLTIVIPKYEVYNFIKYQESGVIRPILESSFSKE